MAPEQCCVHVARILGFASSSWVSPPLPFAGRLLLVSTPVGHHLFEETTSLILSCFDTPGQRVQHDFFLSAIQFPCLCCVRPLSGADGEFLKGISKSSWASVKEQYGPNILPSTHQVCLFGFYKCRGHNVSTGASPSKSLAVNLWFSLGVTSS